MRLIRSTAEMQRLARNWRHAGVKVAFIPTMGYLHAGHLSLIQHGRALVGLAGRVVVSIYVNPTQFGPKEDFSSYPRDLQRDRQLCRKARADILFAPADREMYSPAGKGAFSTFVLETSLSERMEGAARPTHFRGVTTVVAKLFNIVLPDVAVFGAKDYQQAMVIRRMVRDLNFPVRIVVAPTRREPDGLAMSSRNKYLSPEERRQAPVLWRAIGLARELVRRAPRPVSAIGLIRKLTELIHEQPAARVDYVAVFDPDTLEPVQSAARGTHLALAVFVGKTRLIDNGRL